MVVCKSHKLPSTQKTVWEWLTSQSAVQQYNRSLNQHSLKRMNSCPSFVAALSHPLSSHLVSSFCPSCRSRMLQELHLQQWRHKVTRFSREISQQPGLHIHDLCPKDVWDHSGVRELWARARRNAPCWCVLPLRQAGDLGWLPWRWANGKQCWFRLSLICFACEVVKKWNSQATKCAPLHPRWYDKLQMDIAV